MNEPSAVDGALEKKLFLFFAEYEELCFGEPPELLLGISRDFLRGGLGFDFENEEMGVLFFPLLKAPRL